MNTSVKIFPSKELLPSLTWGQVKSDLEQFNDSEPVEFRLIGTTDKHPFLRVRNTYELPVYFPIIYFNNVEEIQENIIADMNFFHKKQLEFPNGKILYWNLDRGIKGLYEINEDTWEDSISRPLEITLENKYLKCLTTLKFLIEIETDLEENPKKSKNPIFPISYIFSKYVDGVIFFETRCTDFPIPSGCYTQQEWLEGINNYLI